MLPTACVVCGRAEHVRLCDGCRADLPHSGSACPVCAINCPGGQVCGACLTRPPAFDATVAAFRYAHPVDRLIQSLKYGHDLAVAHALGGIMAQVRPTARFDLIMPVPLHRARLAQRGFNQSVELARAMVGRGVEAICLDGLVRHRATMPQAGLSLTERRRNLRRAFVPRRTFVGQSVLVVDDVMTTGATLDAVARCLKQAGAREVVNLVCARTPAPR
ncbi:ComF family protein [Nitrogeniibacter mangrovi]|uniref:ComF family protein n=2 Tax=Nitrogeniibacter mangrovi TaxID=2016596 RepID=A0A6C1BA07_9RHOO|nr:ComF family protein [Nitrogeniibacter mangrovi]